MSYDHAPVVANRVDLTDVGLPDWCLAQCVDLFGRYTFWLLDPDADDGGGNPGPKIPAHEQLGPLPGMLPWKIDDSLHRCRRAAPTTGIPCRQRVTTPGEACRFHRGDQDGGK